MKVGFITGTGFYTLPNLKGARREVVTTPFGDVDVESGEMSGCEVVFIVRHGKQHTIAPSDINYRANIYAMHMKGVKVILATAVSGSMNLDWPPGTLVLLEQFLDFTYGRSYTFYPMDGKLAHVDVTHPYCGETHKIIQQAAQNLGIRIQPGGVYACFNGPRFETSAEIKMATLLGANLVGQTGFPECVLARELAISYASVAVVSNYAAGLASTLTAVEVSTNLTRLGDTISNLFQQTLDLIPDDFDSAALHALDDAFL